MLAITGWFVTMMGLGMVLMGIFKAAQGMMTPYNETNWPLTIMMILLGATLAVGAYFFTFVSDQPEQGTTPAMWYEP